MKTDQSIAEYSKLSHPFLHFSDLEEILHHIENKKMILLGSSTHGSKEFLLWSWEFIKEISTHQRVDYIAFQSTWPSFEVLNDRLSKKNFWDIKSTLLENATHPGWIWTTKEMLEGLEWLHQFNIHSSRKIRLFGLDLFSFFSSLRSVLNQVKILSPACFKDLSSLYEEFIRYQLFNQDEFTFFKNFDFSKSFIENHLIQAFQLTLRYQKSREDSWPNIIQNAYVVLNSFRYYKAFFSGNYSKATQIRSIHMADTVEMLSEFYGNDSRGIVIGHNAHLGNAAGVLSDHTPSENMGSLLKERFGDRSVFILGMLSASGETLISDENVLAPRIFSFKLDQPGTIESILIKITEIYKTRQFYILFPQIEKESPLFDYKTQYEVGLISQELKKIKSKLPERFDGILFFEKTNACSLLSPMIAERALQSMGKESKKI